MDRRRERGKGPDFRAWLLGKIAFVAIARPKVGMRLRADYEALEAKPR